ncbi:endolytic transglycosylase MltG [Alkalilimnicola sp. S0819]|uniref:endolytic transglycosylase MltG n=1 Tax=Alkalilimnicola sp. S0819 TaxID=2613922 RepID=UPI001261E403|nr:endolytic transglycosylase MltG [Alkalilimnicola sp. S0819]KAB7627613.1 endolytic transglycosylase MltG [Alkalilimnicola sp. S0819]MPQ15775.1 endolytic transglycosylase MltG [Alkalilimnicola sp. S0819]
MVALKRLLLAALMLALLGAGVLFLAYRELAQTPLVSEAQTLEVPRGTPFAHLARDLGQRGWVDRPWLLRVYARLSGKSARIQAGEYRVEAGMSALELVDRMVRGEVLLHGFTIVEGWTFKQLREALAAHPALDHRTHALSGPELMARLGHPGEHPEGRFLPETYHFPRGFTDLELYRRAYQAMAQTLSREWEARSDGLPLDSPYEALILASIIERETAVPAERPRIAGVFVRRLLKGMRLQTDPTVIYGMGDRYRGDIRFRDLRRDTPYNTYTRGGLTPTPIAMPSAAAIHAALHPAEGDELYFVSRNDGSHVFSATLQEHNQAVNCYQRKRGCE